MRWPTFALALSLTVLSANAASTDARIQGTARVVDGDTLDIGVVRIRLHGIDAPEAGQACRQANGRSWRCGTAATDRLAQLVERKEIACRARDRDAYGRIVADCWQGDIHVNATLVAEGLAWAFTRYSDEFEGQEAIARAAGLGIWNGEAEPSWDYRANRWARAAETSPRPGCPIKGNISQKSERIYHTPWSPVYERTEINEAAGDRWFCDEAEAQAAGWRPARWR